jgi:hypothetical protein
MEGVRHLGVVRIVEVSEVGLDLQAALSELRSCSCNRKTTENNPLRITARTDSS